MGTRDFAGGALRVTYPDSFDAPDELTWRPALRDAVGDPASQIVDALGEQFTLVQPLELRPSTDAANTRMSSRSESATWTVDLDVAADENAVILLDEDGVLSWQLPAGRTGPADAPRTRMNVPLATVTFHLTVRPAGSSDGVRDVRGGVLAGAGRLRAYVFKFVATAVAGQAMTFLERDTPRGLVVITSPDPRRWTSVENLAGVKLPSDRGARILLLVHGAISSTLHSFAGLAATADGRQFLRGAIAAYDAVVGFDHPTLSRDPMENATDLLRRLQAAELPAPATIDVLCYSRGGLVARSLIEYLLPSATWRANTGRVVFVAAANGGTSLAEPEHWNEFVDLFTNLVTASASAIAAISGALPISEIVRRAVGGVGAFVKYLVAYAVDGGGVPGLAAMEPDGDFVRRINRTQPGQPGPGTPWFVISSDFRLELFGEGDRLTELPPRLIAKLADGVADRLFKAPNDLVVDTASMSAIDIQTGGFVKDSLAFAANARVHHLAYFFQPDVAEALSDWLVGERGAGVVAPGSVVTVDLPRSAQRDIVTVDIDDPISVLRDKLKAKPTWVIVRKMGGMSTRGPGRLGGDRGNDGTELYTLDLESMSAAIRGLPAAASVLDAMPSDGLQASASIEIGDPLPPSEAASAIDVPPPVVVDRGSPVAVVPRPEPPASLDDLVDRGLAPRRRSTRGTRAAAAAAPAGESATEAHLQAWLPDRVQRGETVTVTCKLSREGLIVPDGGQEGGFIADAGQDIVIQLVPMLNAEVVGSGRVSLRLPPAGQIEPVFFDFKPTQTGTCEVWIVARQGASPLLSLILKATVEEEPTGAAGQNSAEARASTKPVDGLEHSQVLNIYETLDGGKVRYVYDMFDEQLGLSTHGVSPADLGDREQYVKSIYSEIENARISSETDAAGFQELLQDLGASLFTKLFPEDLQKELWKHRNELARLVVRSSEPFIPWELVHLKDPARRLRPQEPLFLGKLGLVRWLTTPGVGIWSRSLRRRPERVRALCARYANPFTPTLPEIDQEERFLKEALGATPVEPTDRAVRDLLRNGGFDIFHFAGHGLAKPDSFQQAAIQIGDVEVGGRFDEITLSANTVESNADLNADGTGGPLVFLNACQVGKAGLQLGSMGGFAQAFLRSGAAAFVSTLWSVGDAPARTFGETFYKQLLQGNSVAEAVTRAREEARQSGDVSWLAYVVYANPSARMQPP